MRGVVVPSDSQARRQHRCGPKDEFGMIGPWSNWKSFPNAHQGEHIQAPIGPGVYEVCHVSTQELVAFGHTSNVARALSNVLPPAGRKWPFFRRAARPRYRSSELEYRTCAAGSLAEARVAAEQLIGHRQALWRRFSPMQRI